jgi:FMN phosphatase YigB (HAD superfamily)
MFPSDVTAVAFDFGGMLTHSAFDGVAAYGRTLGLPDDALGRYFRDDPMMARLEVGEISSKDYFKYICIEAEKGYGQRLNLRALATAASEGERLNPAMIELVEEMGHRCPVALVTNNVADAGWRATFPYHSFTVVIDSSELGIRKPDPASTTSCCASWTACPVRWRSSTTCRATPRPPPSSACTP